MFLKYLLKVTPIVKHCNKDLCNDQIEDESKCRESKLDVGSNGNTNLAIHAVFYVLITIVQFCKE